MLPEGFGCTQLICGLISLTTRLYLLSLLKRLSYLDNMFCCFAFLPLHGPLQLYLFHVLSSETQTVCWFISENSFTSNTGVPCPSHGWAAVLARGDGEARHLLGQAGPAAVLPLLRPGLVHRARGRGRGGDGGQPLWGEGGTLK